MRCIRCGQSLAVPTPRPSVLSPTCSACTTAPVVAPTRRRKPKLPQDAADFEHANNVGVIPTNSKPPRKSKK